MVADFRATTSVDMRLSPMPVPRLPTSEGDSMPASRRILIPLVAATALALGLAPPVFAGKTLEAVKARGEVICGVNTSAPGFSSTDSTGRWQGLDVDMCRALAAAVLVHRHESE